MKSICSIAIFGAMLAFAPRCLAQREFTSKDGKKLRAGIVRASESSVTLKREADGKEFEIPLSRLSEEDQDVVNNWLESKKLNTRPKRELTLTFEGGQTKKVEIPEGDYLTEDGTLTLFPGDSIHLEFDEAGKPQLVSKVKEPNRTVTFSMTQEDGVTILSRTTQMQKTVAMDCSHRGLGSDKFFRTNLRPTEKGLASFDSWPGAVWTLRLSHFEVTDRPASEVYQERVSK